jgi:hypothetical protein
MQVVVTLLKYSRTLVRMFFLFWFIQSFALIPASTQPTQHAQSVPSKEKTAAGPQNDDSDEIPLWRIGAVPPLREESAPEFIDEQEASLYQRGMEEYRTYVVQHSGATDQVLSEGFINDLRNRNRKLAAQYGAKDPKATGALEEIALATLYTNDLNSAKAAVDEIIRLREPEGNNSVPYWKALKLRCQLEASDHDLTSLAVCDHAFAVGSHQPNVTTLEMATWLRKIGTLASDNPKLAIKYMDAGASYYAKLPEISSSFLAAEYRKLTLFALQLNDNKNALRFNEITNYYLAQGDADAQKAMLSADIITGKKRVDASRLRARIDRSQMTEEQKRRLDEEDKKRQADALADRPQDQMVNILLSIGQTRGTTEPLEESADSSSCDFVERMDKASGMVDLFMVLLRSKIRSESAGQKLITLSSMGFGFTSLIQACTPAATLQQAVDGTQKSIEKASATNYLPGYATMVQFKGAFTESIAPRSATSLPGSGGSRDQFLKNAPASLDKLVSRLMAVLPPQEQQELKKLPPEQRAMAANVYWQQLQRDHPAQAAQIQKQAFEDPETTAAAEYFQKLEKSGKDETAAWRNTKPLAFLNMLQAGEAFVDIYEYKVLSGDSRGNENYLAVIGTANGTLRKVQLGPANVIDAAVNSFKSAVDGGTDVRPHWKALQQKVVQPVLSALPTGTKRMWLSPDSLFSFAPFASLALDMGSPLEIAVIPSPYDFVRIRSSHLPSASAKVLFVGNLNYGPGTRFLGMYQTKTEIDSLSSKAHEFKLESSILEWRSDNPE